MKMQFTVGMGRNDTLQEIPALARLAEECGFSHITFLDEPILARDPYVMMSLAALNTRRIRIGQGVTTPITYHPMTTANATASIDEISKGRAFLGIGAGAHIGNVMHPVPIKELRETVIFIRKFMSGEETEWKGTKVRSEWIRRPVPIYMAAAGPKSLRLAGELADGVICYGVHPVLWQWYLEQIAKGAEKARRDPSQIDSWARTISYVAESKEAARREVAAYNTYLLSQLYERDEPDVNDLRSRLEKAEPGVFEESRRVWKAQNMYDIQKTDAPYGKLATQRLIDVFALTGRPEEICERIEELGRLGVKTISSVTYTIIDKKVMIRRISKEIMPRFRS